MSNNDNVLPTDPKERKAIPISSGVLDYFPAAIAEIAKVSKIGNDQHNPGEDLHWARGKSMDHADTMQRHLMDRGKIDTDGQRHTAKAAWRMLALLQEEMEEAGAPMSRASRVVDAGLTPVVEALNPSPELRVKWVVRTSEWSVGCAADPGTCAICWRAAEPGEIVDPLTAVRVLVSA